MVKRLLGLFALAALLLVLTQSHSVSLAARKKATKKKKSAPPAKVWICHIPEETAPLGFPKLIPTPALDGHLGHGDCVGDDIINLDEGVCTCRSPE